jgi:hypothetical protein
MQDILETVTEENVDRFMKDLDRFVRDLPAIKKAIPDVKTDGFEWIDDGKDDVSIVFEGHGVKVEVNTHGINFNSMFR